MTTLQDPPRPSEALLLDGSTVSIRPLGPEDHDAVLSLHRDRLSAEHQRLRFFGVSRRAPEQTADRLCGPPRPGFLALGAWHGTPGEDEDLVGVVEYEVEPEQPERAELAVAVADDRHHQGVGTLLIEHLLHAARLRGVRVFLADALADNHAMHRVFTDLGLHTVRHWSEGAVRVEVPLDEDAEEYLTQVDERGRLSDLASLEPLMRPRSVAVVGASRQPGSVGHSVLLKLRQARFTGTLWAVNEHAAEVGGVACWSSVGALPGVPDLAVLAVPAARVAAAAADCGRAGVHALVVLTSGLTHRQAQQLLETCRTHSMRLVGPNCLGVADTDPEIRLDAEFGGISPQPGVAGVAVQSGGVGIALVDRLNRLGLGVSSFVSLGDKYDVSGNDLLQWWESDHRTRLAVLHLESFGSPRAFARTARRVSRAMPVLTVDAGRTDAGRRGAASHTAAAATPTVTRQELFRRAGITATRSIAELVDTAALLATQPLPGVAGSVAVVANAGGLGVLAADACAEAGLTVRELPPTVARRLAELLPAGAGVANPVDTTPAVTPERLAAAVDVLAVCPAIDIVVLCLAPTALAQAPLAPMLSAGGPVGRRKPVALVLVDQIEQVRCLDGQEGHRFPAYADAQSAARALAHAVDRARWLARSPSPEALPTTDDPTRANAFVERYLAAHSDGGWLDPPEVAELLGCYGLPLSEGHWATSEAEALAAARSAARRGHDGKLVLKAHWPGQVHKSELGAVRVLPGTLDQVRAAYRSFAARFEGRLDGVLVQPYAGQGTELLAGVVQDPVFGPLVVFGLGGAPADLLADRSARLAPLTEDDVHDLITSLRASPLLFGYRGTAPADLDGLADLLAGLSRMACDLPQLAEAELNPVLVTPEGLTAVDARVRLEPRPAPDPYLRRLRRLPDRTV